MVERFPFEILENNIEYTFQNKDYLIQAMTHSSFINEHEMTKPSCNERLEFLGDSILEMVSSDYFYHAFPQYMEGDLSKIRATLVCERALGNSAREVGLGEFLLLGKGMDTPQSRSNDSIISDAFEAVIAAIYLDGGLEPAKKFIHAHVLNDLSNKLLYNDAKTILQERLQKNYKKATYELIGESGPDHDHVFTVQVFIDGQPFGKGDGHTKKQAEQEAAYETLKQL